MKLNQSVSSALKKLSKLLPNHIFLVGGFVRDTLCGYQSFDIDICGQDTPEVLFDSLKNSEFVAKTTSPKLMTLKIKHKDLEFEYTTFRKESYTKGHSPSKVEPTDSILEDAKRRDFKINAIYYDINDGALVDPLDALADLGRRIISTVDEPKKVFSRDGLRLMRLARFAGQLGFDIEQKTLEAAKEYSHLIKDIAPQRIREELDKILVADTCHNVPNGHIKALRVLDEIGVLAIILPELTLGKGMIQRADFHKHDVFEHTLQTVRFAPPQIRLAALLHDIAKPYCFLKSGRYARHDIEGERITKEVMTRLCYSNKQIARVSRLVRWHMYDLNNQAKLNTLRVFIQNNADIVPDLIELKMADSKGSGVHDDKNLTAVRMQKVYNDMVKEQVPFAIKDLKINGEDLLLLPQEKRGIMQRELLKQCAYFDSDLKTREKQLAFVAREINRYKK
ncbi:MAG: CCA tRNA nucleotidyltransferase [Clostridiales bacterium]|nr:CCA tRNA nucleotidyltransferase [Clostridiales bacterium]